MAGKSPIEWTEQTWNPIVGCSIVSPGCTNCYAMQMAGRIAAINEAAAYEDKAVPMPHYSGTTKRVNDRIVWTGKLGLAPDSILLAPLKRKKPTTYFVNSMGDLFHEDCPDEWIDKVFAVMALCPQHTFQVLTKRAGRMRDFCNDKFTSARIWLECERRAGVAGGRPRDPWPLPNVWLGVSTERQQEADERIPLLLQTPAAVRFISAEPLLGHIALHALNLGTRSPSNALRGVCCVPDDSAEGYHNEPTSKLDWVIVGGESGAAARPMHPDWARSIRDWCKATGVAFFFKQWGEWWEVESNVRADDGEHIIIEDVNPLFDPRTDGYVAPDGCLFRDDESVPVGVKCRWMTRLGKKAAGRHLDGVLHDAMPQADGRGGA